MFRPNWTMQVHGSVWLLPLSSLWYRTTWFWVISKLISPNSVKGCKMESYVCVCVCAKMCPKQFPNTNTHTCSALLSMANENGTLSFWFGVVCALSTVPMKQSSSLNLCHVFHFFSFTFSGRHRFTS